MSSCCPNWLKKVGRTVKLEIGCVIQTHHVCECVNVCVTALHQHRAIQYVLD